MKIRFVAVLLLAGLAASPLVRAGEGLLGLDHRVSYDASGIWSRDVQLGLMYSLLATEVGIAAWEGGDSRLGKTAWQSIDSTVATGLLVQGMKVGFSRARPRDSADPNQWFKGGGNASFPSGEASLAATVVTPFILEYGREHPSVYSLALLPAYDAVARVKTWGHWQSDVLAGVAIGAAMGWYMHGRESPLVLSVLPDGVHVGLSKRW
ncbi:MAG: hypothetical protein RLZZ393_2151 [Pseudomonadota bacterium]|jgi:undecaprenyl-diphosphatase